MHKVNAILHIYVRKYTSQKECLCIFWVVLRIGAGKIQQYGMN